MRSKSHNKKYFFLILGFSFTSPSYAYLDPGTGSALLQGLIGGIAAVISFFSIYWHKVKSFFRKKNIEISSKAPKNKK